MKDDCDAVGLTDGQHDSNNRNCGLLKNRVKKCLRHWQQRQCNEKVPMNPIFCDVFLMIALQMDN